MDIERPEVSVIMPVWNGEKNLRAAVESILVQKQVSIEFIIIDDGSTDETPAILQDYANLDPRIRIICMEHQGIVNALNSGVAAARSKWIARMDADDIAAPDRIARQLNALKQYPDAVLCHTNFEFLYSDGQLDSPKYFPTTQGKLMLQLCWFCPIAHPTTVFRKDVFEECGGYLEEERHAEDYGLWVRILQKGRIIGLPQPLLKLRKHDNSISVTASEAQILITQRLSELHCRCLMDLNERDAIRASMILRNKTDAFLLNEWLWFFTHALPRLRVFSLNAWLYAGRIAIQQLLCK